MLHLDALRASVGDTVILDGIDLDVPAGEVHALLGPNGAGKTTLANVLAGRGGYTVSGAATLDGTDLLGLSPEDRAAAGLFVAFQHPVELPGVGNLYFLRTALNALRSRRELPEVSAVEFLPLAKQHMAALDMDPSLLSRSVNAGFSGGEKKRNEMLQLSMLAPRLVILDETDSGLDIDAVRVVTSGIGALREPDRAMLVITHHLALLDAIEPDRVHVLDHGRIVRSGGREVVDDLAAHGYRTAVARR
jgi:Fe-S cluster assembly ATP-binding protein